MKLSKTDSTKRHYATVRHGCYNKIIYGEKNCYQTTDEKEEEEKRIN